MAGAVRHPIDQAKLERYLQETVPEIKCPLNLKQFGFGQSNPTYQLTAADGQRYVLRKKPPGKLVSQSAHKVEREYRVLKALAGTDVPVPRTYCLCEDPDVIGTPFYVMEFLDGRIIEDFSMPGVSPAERDAMWKDAVRTLARMHSVRPADVGLENFGRAGGFYNRQIKTWETICQNQSVVRDVDTGEAVGDLPHMAELMRFFKEASRQPVDRVTLVHGDYKIDNLVFHKTEPRVIGILDWEMATIGHPLSDYCNLLTRFVTASLRPASDTSERAYLPGVTPGLPTIADIGRWYAETSGYDPISSGEYDFGMAFNLFRLAAVLQGIAARWARRQASNALAHEFALQRGPLAENAWSIVSAKLRAKL